MLDRVARDIVLDNVRGVLSRSRRELVADLRSHGDLPLAEFLSESGRDLADVYGRPGQSWMGLRREAGLPALPAGPQARRPARGCPATTGGSGTRSGSVEVDLVGVDQWPGAGTVGAVGSIKWRDRGPFDQRDLADLAAHRGEVPGGRDAMLVAVSRSGCTAQDLAAVYGPDDLVSAWR